MGKRKIGAGSKSLIIFTVPTFFLVVTALVFITYGQERRTFDDDPKVSFAHGTFFWDGGVLEPGTEYLLDVQIHYILQYEELINQTYEADGRRIKDAIYSTVSDAILANALYLDWLIQKAGDEGLARDSITNDAIRWYYISTIQDDPEPSLVDGYWAKGIDLDQFEALRFLELDIFDRLNKGDSNDADQCIAAGVPVPDKLFDNEWQSFGALEEYFGNARPYNEVGLYLSDEPPGYCMSLTRSGGPDAREGHIDLICVGQESSNACFFETPGFDNDIQGAIDITDLLAGEGIVGPGTVAPCTSCHVGENPLIIHPQDPAFIDALQAKSMEHGTPISWNTKEYFKPFGVPSWPLNPPPLDLSTIPRQDEVIERCSGCHNTEYAGRFPSVALMTDPTLYDDYCTIVVRGVLQGINNLSPTMPMNDLSNTSDYDVHKDYLLAMCNESDLELTVDDDSSFLAHPETCWTATGSEAEYGNFYDASMDARFRKYTPPEPKLALPGLPPPTTPYIDTRFISSALGLSPNAPPGSYRAFYVPHLPQHSEQPMTNRVSVWFHIEDFATDRVVVRLKATKFDSRLGQTRDVDIQTILDSNAWPSNDLDGDDPFSGLRRAEVGYSIPFTNNFASPIGYELEVFLEKRPDPSEDGRILPFPDVVPITDGKLHGPALLGVQICQFKDLDGDGDVDEVDVSGGN